MDPFQLANLRNWRLEEPDHRLLADIGIDRFGNPLEGNDPRFRRFRHRTPGLFARLIEAIVVRASPLWRADF
jgi:hypothetical protein